MEFYCLVGYQEATLSVPFSGFCLGCSNCKTCSYFAIFREAIDSQIHDINKSKFVLTENYAFFCKCFFLIEFEMKLLLND